MTDLVPLFGSDDKQRKFTFEQFVGRRFIKPEVGMGLVSKKLIPAGSVVFAETVAWTTEEEHLACQSMKEVNVLLASKVKAMGPEWFRKFLNLPNSHKDDLGVFAGIWDLHQMPIVMNGKRAGILGLNLASVNHACIPNCTLTTVSQYPKAEDGNEMKDKKPTLERIIVRATQNIPANAEITIPYWYAKGQHKARELFGWTEFNFFCSCQSCAKPSPTVEDALDMYNKLELKLCRPESVEKRPAMAFRSAQEVVAKLLSCGIRDARVPMLWFKCGLIAGYHSDVGRALCFLGKAYKMLEILEGTEGVFYKQILSWYMTPSLMPGFGVTTRGLSTVKEGEEMLEKPGTKEVLYMIAAEPREYVRLSRYRRLSDAIAIVRGSRYIVVPEERTKSKVVSKAGPSNQRHSSDFSLEQAKSGAPETVYRSNGGPSSLEKGKEAAKNNALNTKFQASKGNNQTPIRNPSSSDTCTDPELDLLDVCLELKMEFPEAFSEGQSKKSKKKKKKKKKKKGKKNMDKGKAPQQEEAPVVKDLGAKKKVVMVKRGEGGCARRSSLISLDL
ncbi:hypothetical protein BDV29DRAFT_152179 [Aspergillus leporis]|uniref:SET domain-containing protein n=1 Tax=Aspergillus leporis TaxID=41062 RepID=A0A5N5XE71_9EURO|nr:hypothetical protein BDV29DRAFT_152179 [Aspergillus leporis]